MNAVVEDLELPEGGDTAMGWERGIAWVRVGVVAMVRRVVVERRRAREPGRRDLDLDLDLVRYFEAGLESGVERQEGWAAGSVVLLDKFV